MIQIPMTPELFAKVRATLVASPEVLSRSDSGPRSGSFATAQVGFTYSFTPNMLNLNVTARHGLANFASESEIKDHVLQLLAKA